jgi:hypothetical protein
MKSTETKELGAWLYKRAMKPWFQTPVMNKNAINLGWLFSYLRKTFYLGLYATLLAKLYIRHQKQKKIKVIKILGKLLATNCAIYRVSKIIIKWITVEMSVYQVTKNENEQISVYQSLI